MVLSTTTDIRFTLNYRDKQLVVHTFLNEFSDLRALIIAKLDFFFFGECGGVGRCVTCIVVLNLKSELNQESQEQFACQTAIDYRLSNANIRIIGDRLNPF